MVLNKFTGSVLMDGNEDDLFKVFGTTLKHFASYVYLKALQVGDSIRIRVYDKVDDVSRYKLDGDVTDSVGGNNGTVTNISSLVSQWKFDGNVLDSIGSNNGTITYHTNLKALYKFDNTINDSTSGAHNLTLAAGTTTYVTGQEGQAVSFDGSTYYTANSAVIVSGTGDRSVSFWVRTPSSFVSNSNYLFSWGAGSYNNLFGAVYEDTSSTQSRILFVGFGNDVTSVNYLQANTWYHLVFTLSSSGTVRKMYINGVLDSSNTTTALNTTSSSLFIGSTPGGSLLNSGNYIDEFRIYSVLLTQAQVSALYMNGKFAQSHTFDNGEYVSKTSPVGIPTGTSDRTVSLWLNPSTITVGTMIFWGAETPNNGFGVGFDGSGHINAIGWSNDVTSTSVITANVWTHVVVVLSSSGTVRTIYINGVQDKQSTTTALNTSSSTIYTGNRADLGDPYIGQLDEVRVYNAALSASQVLGLYNYTGSNYVTPLPVGNALSLDGSSYVSITNQTPYNFERTNAFSVSGWFKTTSANQQVLVGHKSSSNSLVAGWDVWQYTDGTIRFEIASTATQLQIQTGSAYNDGNFHNFVCTYDGSANRSGMKLYIDGVLITTGTSLSISTTVANSQNVTIGADGSGNAKYTGLLDEVQVFNYVVSSAEINAINAGRFGNTHPIGLWHFDGNLYDYSGQGSTGSPTGTMTYVTGSLSGSYNVPNTHFNFDGSETINAGNGSNLSFEYTQPFSFSFWAKFTSTATLGVIGKTAAGLGGNGYWLYFTNGNLDMQLVNVNNTNDIVVATSSTYNDGLLHHFVVTYTGNGKASGITIYVDGSAVSTSTVRDNLANKLITNTQNVVIGGLTVSDNQLVAELDDVRIYNRALSAGEVLDLFNYPDSPMKELIYDRTYSGVVPDAKYIPPLQGNQYKVTAQQTSGTNRIIPWEREEINA